MHFFQFVVTPSNLEKSIKLQLPIMLATYPLRNDDGTLRRSKGMAEYPTTLPIFRPWLDEKTFQWWKISDWLETKVNKKLFLDQNTAKSFFNNLSSIKDMLGFYLANFWCGEFPIWRLDFIKNKLGQVWSIRLPTKRRPVKVFHEN